MASDDRFRFSITSILAITAVCAVGMMSLRTGGWFWARLWFSLVLVIQLTSVLGVVYRSGSARAFWIGFALFGWTYMAISVVPAFRIAEYQLFGRELADSLKEYAPAQNPGLVIQARELGIPIFTFSQTLTSTSVLAFAVLGGFIARWFYSTRKESR